MSKPFTVRAEPSALVAERGVKPVSKGFDDIEAARGYARVAKQSRFVNSEGGKLAVLAFRYARVWIEDEAGVKVE